ncbi:MAG: terminase small subunit, partial [Candidatus Omnitrophota bacterium]
MEETQQISEKPTKKHKITPKRRIFIEEYLKDFNGTDAAIRAGYSPNSAYSQSSDFLKTPEIQEEIEARMQKRLEKIGVTKDRVLTEIAHLAFSDNRRLYRKDGSLLMPTEWGDEIAAAVAGVETIEEFSGRGDKRTLIGLTKKVR